MSQWTKRRGAGLVRGLLIGMSVAVMILVLYVTGILQIWLDDISWGIGMFFQQGFYTYIIIIVILVSVVIFFIRSTINWGGA